MKYSRIGELIKRGKTSPEIRREINGFPFRPTIKYFMQLGCKESIAREYKQRLEKNDEKLEEEEFEFISSGNADSENIIIDTCALAHEKTIEVIEKAKEVTVLLATIKEMDAKKDIDKVIKTEGNAFLAENIRLYSKKFLLEDKYKMVPFDGIKKDDYHDDKIIQYLMMMSVKDRPTILTVDADLCDKAKCFGLEYILYNPDKFVLERPNKKTQNFKSSDKKENKQNSKPQVKELTENKESKKTKGRNQDDRLITGGVEIQLEGQKIQLKKYNKTAVIMYLDIGGKYQEIYSDNELLETKNLIIIRTTKEPTSMWISKIEIRDGNITEEKKQYFYLNEVYLENLPEEVEEVARREF